MDELKQRLIGLVQNFLVEEPVKQSLLEEIEGQGVTEQVLNHVQEILDKSIADYQELTAKEMQQLDARLSYDEQELVKEFRELQLEIRQQKSETIKQQDQQQIEEIRKKLSE
jgi:hypothetical protein